MVRMVIHHIQTQEILPHKKINLGLLVVGWRRLSHLLWIYFVHREKKMWWAIYDPMAMLGVHMVSTKQRYGIPQTESKQPLRNKPLILMTYLNHIINMGVDMLQHNTNPLKIKDNPLPALIPETEQVLIMVRATDQFITLHIMPILTLIKKNC